MSDALAFGQDLRRARERRGLSLEQMAEQTKISASLFAGLERGDLSRWPSGIFRRAFVRSYAETVGLPAEETVARFLSAHPEDHGESSPAAAAADAAALPGTLAPRLTLVPREDASAPPAAVQPALPRRFALPIVDVLSALVPATLVGQLVGWNWFWATAACTGFGGHLLFSWLGAGTPGALLLPAGSLEAARTAPRVAEARPAPKAETEEVAASPVSAAAPPLRRRQLRHGGGPRPVATRQRRVPH